MEPSKIREYILKYKDEYSRKSIETQLLNNGANKDEIQMAFDSLGENNQKANSGKSGLALAFVLIGFFVPFLGIFTLIPGLILAHQARKIDKEDGLAIASLIIGYITLVLIIIGILFFFLIFTQTYNSLQSKSLEIGRDSQERLTTDLEVVQVLVYDTSDGQINGGIDNISIIVRLGSGSMPIKFEDTLIKMNSDSSTSSMNYRYSTDNISETTYVVEYLLTGDLHVDNYLSQGDSAKITFTTLTGINISNDSRVIIRIIPINGVIKPIDLKIPNNFVEEVSYLYP